MKKKILVKLISVVAILGLIKSSIVLAQEKVKNKEQQEQKNIEQQNGKQQEQKNVEQQQNAEQQQKKLSPKEEKEQQKQQEIKTIKEALNKLKSLEEQMQKKLNNMFKDFKKEDYEVKDYDLEVFKKNNVPILVYTHKKTGAQVYFNLCLDKDKLKEEQNFLAFRAPCKDDRGLIHFSEHCLAGDYLTYFIKNFKCTPKDINAFTFPYGLAFVSRAGFFGLNEKLEKEYVKRLTEELNNPPVFEKGSNIFQVEKKRIINESKDSPYETYLTLDDFKKFLFKHYNVLGETSKLANVSLKDFEKFYKKYIHPSNCLLVKNVADLKPEKIKNYLNMWNEKYFSRYDKKQITNNKYEVKNKAKYSFNSWPKDSNIFSVIDEEKDKKQSFKYMAEGDFDLMDSAKQKEEGVTELNLDFLKEELKNFVKSLGYDDFKIDLNYRDLEYEDFDMNLKGLNFYGNKKDYFKEEVLKENYKKVMNFILNKLKNLNEEEFLYSRYYDFKNYNKFQIDNLNLKNTDLWCSPQNFQKFKMSNVVLQTFFQTGKAIADLNFIFNDKNEIESSYESLENCIKKSLKDKSSFYDKIALNGPKYINVFKQSDKTLEQTYKKEVEKYGTVSRVVPIKIKNKNSKKFVEDFAIEFLGSCLFEELSKNKGLIYRMFSHKFLTKNNFRIFYYLNKDSVKRLEDYIFKNFDEIKKNIKFKDKDLNDLKERYKDNFKTFKTQYDEFFKHINETIKDFENYVKTGKIDENSALKKDLKIRDYYKKFFPSNLLIYCKYFLLTFDKNFKDYKEFAEKEMYFKGKYLKRLDEKTNLEFAKDFLENILKPLAKKLKNAYKLSEKKLKELDSVKFSEVEELIKTAYLVKDKKEIKEDNLEIGKKEKIDKEFFNSLILS